MLCPVSRRVIRPIGIFVLFGLTSPVGAAVYCVDSAAALKTALSQAATNSADDEIQIVRGTYVGNFVYASTQANALSVKGGYAAGCNSRTLDPANTILDGNQTGTVLVLSAPDVAAELLVEGLTLRNGKSNGDGGGLYATAGGFSESGMVTIEYNQIMGNTADNNGGGVYVLADDGTVTLTNNYIQGNTTHGSGSVFVYCFSGTTTLINNYIQGNATHGSGSGVFLYFPSIATLTNNYIQGNTSYDGSSGGIYVNSYVSSYSGSGGITLTNNTLVGNASETGGGLYLNLGSTESKTSVLLYNNLFWDNTASDNVGADLVIKNDSDGDYLPVPVTLLANNFDQTETGFQIDIPIPLDPSNLNAQDPLFVDAANGDLHLTADSPMIDAGDPSTPDLPATDLDGGPRVLGAAVDIGAYEYNDGSGTPDFKVTSMVLTPTSPAANTTFSAKITVKNEGTVAGVPGLLQVWTNQGTPQACQAVGNASTRLTNSLNPGASVSVTLTGLKAGTAGSRTFRTFVDSDCATEESLETNNQATKTYTVKPPQPDFVVTGITLTPTSPKVRNLFSAAITVKNQGTVSGEAGFLDVWTNQATSVTCGTIGNAWASVGTLAPNQSKTLTISGLRAEAAGNKTLRAFVDSWCETDETDNANNQKTKAYSVQP